MRTNVLIPVYNGDIEIALKHLKRDAIKAGLFREQKRRAFYEKSSLRKRRKSADARARVRKWERQRAEAERLYDPDGAQPRARAPQRSPAPVVVPAAMRRRDAPLTRPLGEVFPR